MINIKKNRFFIILSQNYVIKSFSLFSLSHIMSGFTIFGIISLYSKCLHPVDFGKISLVWIFIIVISVLVDGGLNSAFAIRFYKVSKEENTKNIYSTFFFNLIIFGIFFIIFFIFPSLSGGILKVEIQHIDLVKIFPLILFMVLGKFYFTTLIVIKKSKNYFIVNFVFNLMLIILNVLFLLVLKLGYISYFWAYLCSYFILTIVGFIFFISNYKPSIKGIITIANMKGLLKIGLPLIPNSLMLMLLTWADRYILNFYVGLSIVGIYTIGYRFAEIIYSFIVYPFGQALFPILYKQYSKSKSKYLKNMNRIMKYYWIVIFSIIIGYLVILKEILQFFIGAEYIKGYNIISIVLLGIVIGGATSLISTTIIMREKTNIIFLFTFISVSLNIVLNFLLIPEYSMYGAAVATLVSYILQFIMVFIYTQKLVFINYDYKFILKSVSVSLLFFISVVFLSYLEINIFIRLGLKVSLFLLFILVSYKFLKLNKAIKKFLNYDIISK